MFRFISTSDSLPKSPNVKMVEVWLLFSLIQPFIDVLLQTYIYCKMEGLEKNPYPEQLSKKAWALFSEK